MAVPKPTVRGVNAVRRFSRKFVRNLPSLRPYDLYQAIAHQTGRVYRRSVRAIESLRSFALRPQDAFVSAFVKADKTNFVAKVNPDPRIIQGRHPRYNVTLQQFVKPIEHCFYNIKSFVGFPKGRMIAKGRNLYQRAKDIRKKWLRFEKPCCLFLDCSRFDAHCDLEILKIAHQVWLKMMREPEFASLLKMQWKNHCYSSMGLFYTVLGRVMSGDVTTSLTATTVMLLLVGTAMSGETIKWDFYDDGDDALIFIESRERQRIGKLLQDCFIECGQELRVDGFTEIFEKIEFCQTRPVFSDRGWVMCRNPIKTINTIFSSHRIGNVPRHLAAHMRAVLECESRLSGAMPVIGVWAPLALEQLSEVRSDYSRCESLLWRSRNMPILGTSYTTSLNCRRSFAKAWDMSVSEQQAIERRLKDLDLRTFRIVEQPGEFDVSQNIFYPTEGLEVLD